MLYLLLIAAAIAITIRRQGFQPGGFRHSFTWNVINNDYMILSSETCEDCKETFMIESINSVVKWNRVKQGYIERKLFYDI
ncbi:hypothetical protein JOC77_002224 [Peribacillus deserti]|uniref:Integrase catalytic domain-containing protein n=1 Tax=Peribacillus deserti TaxID=673318 RepID=A0ABS2QI01_9BACI|nr:hypothetical protein [Peribacillus deserti]